MSTRREFLSRSGQALAWLGLGGTLEGLRGLDRDAWGTGKVLSILHTNDVHSRIDPFPDDGRRNARLAGAARRHTLIEEIRAANPGRVLLLDAGDVFQGTPYFNVFKGEVDFKVMRLLGYDAMTIGNHDFDAGLDGLQAALESSAADFELISANYDFSRTHLRDRVTPYQVFVRDGIRVGVFGLGVALQGLVMESLYRGVTVEDPLPVAREMVAHLRGREACDLVICLSHLGNEGYGEGLGDQQIAREVTGIDLIIGGHSHTFMAEPTRVRHGEQTTLVFQVGFGGIYLGRVDFHLGAGQVQAVRAAALPVKAPAAPGQVLQGA